MDPARERVLTREAEVAQVVEALVWQIGRRVDRLGADGWIGLGRRSIGARARTERRLPVAARRADRVSFTITRHDQALLRGPSPRRAVSRARIRAPASSGVLR